MPHFDLKVEATRYTSREGDHPDDELYRSQLEDQIKEWLKELQFVRAEVKVTWAP